MGEHYEAVDEAAGLVVKKVCEGMIVSWLLCVK